MVGLILILCIVSMPLFDPVASKNSLQQHRNFRPPLDFGFSRLIDKLLSAKHYSSNQRTMFSIFAKVEKEKKAVSKFGGLIGEINGADKILRQYIESANSIDFLYKKVERHLHEAVFLEHPKKLLEKLVKQCNSFNNLGFILNKFRKRDVSTDKNFMDSLIDNMNIEILTDSCWYNTQSPKEKIITLYRELTIITVQAYALRIYAYNFLKETVHERDEYKVHERYNYGQTLRNFERSARKAINFASRKIRSCNDAVNDEGKMYIQLEGLSRPIMINEEYLNEKRSCWKTCPDYQNTKFYGHDPRQPISEQCRGRIVNCFTEKWHFCNPWGSSNAWGPHGSHHESTVNNEVKLKDWCHRKRNYPFINNDIVVRCDMCICYCDDHPDNNDIRRFSLRPVVSAASENRVITGIQFVVKNGVIYLRIQDGKLGPKGVIEKSTVKWQPVDEIDYESSEEVFTITYDRNFVNLDSVILYDGVLTGIGFYVLESHLALKVQGHVFDHSTGILQYDYWLQYYPPRHEIKMTAPDFPYYINESVIVRKDDTYIGFRLTDYEKDAAQTIVPFIDARPVVSRVPVALSGAMIYYSEKTGYGGFIGLGAIVYDYGNVIGN